jgi:hypothetical protein
LADAQHFTWVSKRGVRSTRGFELESVRFGEFTYQENDRVMKLDGEFLYGDLNGCSFGFGFYDTWRTAHWAAPHQTEEITAADRMRIRSNIMEAFAFMDGRAEFA